MGKAMLAGKELEKAEMKHHAKKRDRRDSPSRPYVSSMLTMYLQKS
jgi:hypothetical protein